MGEFFSDLRSILGLRTLRQVGRKALDDDCLGLAGQLAYFTLFSLFPFLLSLVTLAGLMIEDPESVLETLTERTQDFLPKEAVGLLSDYIDRTLRGASSSALVLSILATLWLGWAAANAVIKAINRVYELQETRPLWKLWGISVLMILGFTLVIVSLALVVFGPEVGGYVQRLTGLPKAFLELWGILRWALAFLAVTLALDLLYYVAPNAEIPFKWITPGGFAATVLILVSSLALNLYIDYLGPYTYNQIYGQVGAIIVLMLWLYITGLMVLIGAEMNAVLARMAEERKDTRLVQPESSADEKDG